MAPVRKKRGRTSGIFRPVNEAGPDPRRHVFTKEECSRGGQTTAKRYLCHGRWHLDWIERCNRKFKNEKGEYVDAEKEADGNPGADER